MPKNVAPGLRLGVISPQDAIREFDQRKLLLPSFRWQDVWQEEHQRGFAVAGVMREDVLAIFRDQLEAKLVDGSTLADFKKVVKPALAEKGFWGDVEITDPLTNETRVTRFDDARLQLIYDTNVRQSYAAGQWQRFQDTKAQFPFAMYRTMEDAQVRPAHAAWDGLVLPLDDDFWQTHWAPCGWRCRCHMIQVSQRGIDRLKAAGQKLQFEAPADDWRPYVNPYTGEVKAVPAGVDPGFGYNPGVHNQNRDEALAEQVLQKAARSDAYSAAVMAAQAARDMPALLERRSDSFVRWAADARGAANASGAVFSLGTISAPVVSSLAAIGEPLDTALIAVRDADVLNASGAGAVTLFDQLPALLAAPTAVLRLVDGSRTLIYVIDAMGAHSELQRLYVTMSADASVVVDGQAIRKSMQLVRSASLTKPADLNDTGAYQVVAGTWHG